MPDRIDVARVLTPAQVIVKARVRVQDGKVLVTDRRTKDVLLTIEGEPDESKTSSWKFGDVTVEVMGSCGCGGTRVIPTGA